MIQEYIEDPGYILCHNFLTNGQTFTKRGTHILETNITTRV